MNIKNYLHEMFMWLALENPKEIYKKVCWDNIEQIGNDVGAGLKFQFG